MQKYSFDELQAWGTSELIEYIEQLQNRLAKELKK